MSCVHLREISECKSHLQDLLTQNLVLLYEIADTVDGIVEKNAIGCKQMCNKSCKMTVRDTGKCLMLGQRDEKC